MSNRKRTSEGSKKLTVRILALALAALMVLGSVYLALVFILDTSAAPLDRYAFSTQKTSEDFRLAVGIRYGSSAYPLHSITSPNGFVFGEAEISRTVHSFAPLYTLYETDIAAVVDTNLTVGYQSCEIAKSEAETDIGGYHVELSLENGDPWGNLEDLKSIYYAEYEHVFPAYINGKRTLRIGSFPNYSDASAAAAAIGAGLEGFLVSVASPSSSGVCYLNCDYDTILFEYSGADGFCSGVSALQIDNTDYACLYYSRTSYLYDGVFCFKRYTSSSQNGLSLINLVGVQEYVEGVLPYEISSTWPAECLKAFSIMVRSYAMSNLNRHYSAYGFDVCSSACCQVYQGRKLVTNSVIEAVAATKNMILTYKGSIVNAAYSSSQGGYSVGSQYVWGGALGYFVNQPTPWEDYSNVYGGLWESEISPAELANTFRRAGHSNITGNEIVSLTYQTSDDSPYVYSITATDEKGNSATVTRCEKVMMLMSSKVKSANFTIAKDELTYVYTDVIENRVIDLDGSYSGEISVYTENGIAEASVSILNFFTGIGQAIKDASAAFYIKTGSGTATLTTSEKDIPVSTMPDENGYYTVVSDYGDFLIVSEVRDILKTVKASKEGNYVIAGMGYGHGVGASQYGTLHLAKAGATFDQIVRAYYVGTEIVSTQDFFK